MAWYRVLYWREIPTVVEAGDAAERAVRPLDDRFQTLIDAVAIQLGLDGSDAYLEGWWQSAPEERPGTAAQVAEIVAQELDGGFEALRQRAVASSPPSAGSARP